MLSFKCLNGTGTASRRNVPASLDQLAMATFKSVLPRRPLLVSDAFSTASTQHTNYLVQVTNGGPVRIKTRSALTKYQHQHLDYQPVSYTLSNKRGTRAEYQQMVATCNQAGVKVMAGALITLVFLFLSDGFLRYIQTSSSITWPE